MTVGRLGALHEAIYPDAKKVYLEGLAPDVEAPVLPALSVLAEASSDTAYDGRTSYYGDAILELLLNAFTSSQPALSDVLNLGPEQLRAGLTELFGLGEPRIIKELGDRQNNAAIFFGYKNGGSFRNGKRRGQKTLKWILDEICHQLVTLAEEHGLTPDELGGAPYSEAPLEAIEEQSILDGQYALNIVQLSRALFYELHRVRSNGLTVSEKSIPNLMKLATRAMHAHYDEFRASRDDLEQVLKWAVAQFDEDRYSQGACYLFGIGNARGLDESIRDEHAARCFGYESGTRLREGSKDLWAITFIRDHLILLAGHMEFWPIDEPPGTFF